MVSLGFSIGLLPTVSVLQRALHVVSCLSGDLFEGIPQTWLNPGGLLFGLFENLSYIESVGSPKYIFFPSRQRSEVLGAAATARRHALPDSLAASPPASSLVS